MAADGPGVGVMTGRLDLIDEHVKLPFYHQSENVLTGADSNADDSLGSSATLRLASLSGNADLLRAPSKASGERMGWGG